MLKSALVALLAVLTVGCANLQQPVQQPQQRPVMHQTAVAQAPMIAPATFTEFPTSRNAPQGKPWGTMHSQGFTGGYDVACGLLGLTHNQCVMYQEMHSRGTCQVMDVPNGIVLDRLTFTRNGKHQVDHGALVALRNPPTRKTEVCDLGGGVIAMRFHGCNNHAIVRGWMPRPVVAVQPAVCTPEHLVSLTVWEAKAGSFRGVSEAISASRSGAGHYAPGDVSRKFGATFRRAHAEGQLQKSVTTHQVTVSLMKGGQEFIIHQGMVTGEYRFPLPQGFADGDVLRVVYHDLGRIFSPVSDIRAQRSEFIARGCKTVTVIHAIERGSSSGTFAQQTY